MTTRRPYRSDAQALADSSMTPEAAFQVRVVALARHHGWRPYHTHDSRRSDPGFPDLVLVRPPRVLFVELKVGRRQLTADQREWMQLLERCDQVDAFTLRAGLQPTLADQLGELEAVLR